MGRKRSMPSVSSDKDGGFKVTMHHDEMLDCLAKPENVWVTSSPMVSVWFPFMQTVRCLQGLVTLVGEGGTRIELDEDGYYAEVVIKSTYTYTIQVHDRIPLSHLDFARGLLVIADEQKGTQAKEDVLQVIKTFVPSAVQVYVSPRTKSKRSAKKANEGDEAEQEQEPIEIVRVKKALCAFNHASVSVVAKVPDPSE